MWQRLKLFYFLSAVLFLLFSASLSADVTLTDQEYQDLMNLLDQSDQEMKASEMELSESRQELTESNQELRLLKMELETLRNILTMQDQQINGLETYLKTLKTDPLLSLNLGGIYLPGELPGIYAGIEIQLK